MGIFCILLYNNVSYYFYMIGGSSMDLDRKPIVGVVSKHFLKDETRPNIVYKR